MKLTPATTLAAAVIVGVTGFVVGRISSPSESAGANAAAEIQAEIQRQSPRAKEGEATGRTRESREKETGSLAERKAARLLKLESIMRGENALDRNRALLAFIDQLGPGDFEAAIAHFRALGITENRSGEYALLLTAWAKADPFSALKYATENTRGNFASSTILASWATSDPEAALLWAQQNHEGDGANPFLIGVIRGIAETDPARATDLLTGMPFGDERGEALNGMMQHVLKQGSQASRDWISAIEDDRLRNGAMRRMSEQMAEIDPKGTAEWMASLPNGSGIGQLDDVYGIWAGADETAALKSFASLPAGEIRTDALRGLIKNAASENPQRALNLMNQYPGDVTDSVVQDFARNAVDSDPVTATLNIARITDERRRNDTYRRTLGRWMRNDMNGARQWVQNNPLPEPVQQMYQRMIGPQQ